MGLELFRVGLGWGLVWLGMEVAQGLVWVGLRLLASYC